MGDPYMLVKLGNNPMSLRAKGVAIPIEIAKPVPSETRNLAIAHRNGEKNGVTNHMNKYTELPNSPG